MEEKTKEMERKIYKTTVEEVAEGLYISISENKELKKLELKGFIRGAKKDKTMNVPLDDVVDGLRKQYKDFIYVWNSLEPDKEEMKRTLADLRNTAGCVFLKLVEGGG